MDQNNQHNNHNDSAGNSFFSNLFRCMLPHSSLSDQNNANHDTAHSEVIDTANHPQAPTDIVMSDDEPIPDLIARSSPAPDASQASPDSHNVESISPVPAEYAQNYNIPAPATVDHDDARSNSSMPDLQSVSDSSDDADTQSERDAYDVEMHLAVADDGDSAWTDESMPPLEPAVPDPGAQRRHVALEEVPDPDEGNPVPAPMPANPQHQRQHPQPHLHLPPSIRPLVPPFLHLPRPQNAGQGQGQRQAQPQTLPPFATLMADLTQSFADGQQDDQGQGQGQQQAHVPEQHAYTHFSPPPFSQPHAGNQPGNQNQQGNAPPHGHFHFHDGSNGGMLALSFDMAIIPVVPPSTANDVQPAPAQGEAQPEPQTQGQGRLAPNPNPNPRAGNVDVQILDDTGAERAQWNGTSLTDVQNMFGMLGIPLTIPEGGEAPDIVRAIMQTLMAFGGAGLEPERDDPARARKLIRGLEVVPEGLVKRLERLAKEEGDTGGMSAGCAVCWESLLGEVIGNGWEENTQDSDGDVAMEGVQDTTAPAEAHGTPTVQASSAVTPHDQPTTTTPAGTPPPQAGASGAPTVDSVDEEPLPPIVALPCSHVFHSACLVPWFARPHQTTCPTCRFDIDPEGLLQNVPRRPMSMPMPTPQEERRARMQGRQERAQWRTTFGAGAMPMPGQAATAQQVPTESASAPQPQSQQPPPQAQQPQADTSQPQPQIPQWHRSPLRADAQPTFVPLNFAGGPGSRFWEMSGIMPVVAMPPPGTRIPHLHHHHPQYQQHSPVTVLNRAQTASRDLPQAQQQEQAAGQPADQQPQQSQASISEHEGQQQPAPQSPPAPAPQPLVPQPAQAQPQPQMPQSTPRHLPRPHYQAQPFAFPPFRFGVPPPGPGLRPAPAPMNAVPHRKPTWTAPPPPGPTLRQRVEQRERDAALRCDDVSCGVGPSDEDPTPGLPPGMKDMVSIRPPQADGRVCVHRFHPACLVVSERVAGWGPEDKSEDEARAEVEVGCPVCRAVGVVSREEWQEGARAAV